MSINIAIIPARGGSKRLPDKNLKLFCGKPLIVWTIDAAKNYGKFDLILVSTDSLKIANIASQAGASVPFIRPSSLASDNATTNDVIEHAVNWIEQNENTSISRVTLLQPTSPLRDSNDICHAMQLFSAKKADAVISVSELEHPIQYCNQLSDDLSMSGFLSKEAFYRSQDLATFYRLNGAIYIFDRKFVGNLNSIYSGHSFAYVMDKKKSIDIDDEYDFLIAECIKSNLLK